MGCVAGKRDPLLVREERSACFEGFLPSQKCSGGRELLFLLTGRGNIPDASAVAFALQQGRNLFPCPPGQSWNGIFLVTSTGVW